MTALARELTELEQQRARVTASLEKATDTLRQTEVSRTEAVREQTRLAGLIAPVQRLLADLETSRSARQLAQQDVGAGQQVHAELLVQIDAKLPEGSRYSIEAAIQKIDAEIDVARRDVEKHRAEMVVAGSAFAEGRQQTTAAEAASRDALARLRELPGQIQKARSMVATIRTTAQKAAIAGRASEALYLAGELKQALAQLADVASPQKETELGNRLAEKWLEARAQKAALAKKVERLDGSKSELVTAEGKLQSLMQSRDAGVRRALTQLGAGEPPAKSQSATPAVHATKRRRPVKPER